MTETEKLHFRIAHQQAEKKKEKEKKKYRIILTFIISCSSYETSRETSRFSVVSLDGPSS